MRAVFLILSSFLLVSCSSSEVIYVGTSSKADGIYMVQFDRASGKLTQEYHQDDVKRAGFLAISPDKNHLYAVAVGNKVRAYKIEKDYTLTFLNEKLSTGKGPCHISTSKNGKAVVVANYSSGDTTVVSVAADGSLNGESRHHSHASFKPPAISNRQIAPHAHNTYSSPDGRYCFVADLGLDKIVTFKWDENYEKLELNDPSHASVPPGSGPRHFIFHPNGKFAYVINELNSTVSAFDYEGDGKLKIKQTLDTKPPGWKEYNNCADIHVHPNGKFLYGSNRGSNTIVIYGINEDGTLKLIGHESTKGNWPRNFTLSPDGQFLLVANQKSSDIYVFKIDLASGKLGYTGNSLTLPNPICLKFLR